MLASAIQRVLLMSVAGPQNLNNGNWPSSLCSAWRRSPGWVHTSGSLRPSAGYIGRGVTAQSTDEYMLNHQHTLEHVMSARSHSLGRWTSRFDCRQNLTSNSSRNNHPLPTMPCSDGHVPVR